MNNKQNITQGYIALSTLLIIAAVTLAISVSVSMISVTELTNAFSYSQGLEAKKIAEGCSEEALFQLRSNPSYSGVQ
jgi:hypothetical protein